MLNSNRPIFKPSLGRVVVSFVVVVVPDLPNNLAINFPDFCSPELTWETEVEAVTDIDVGGVGIPL